MGHNQPRKGSSSGWRAGSIASYLTAWVPVLFTSFLNAERCVGKKTPKLWQFTKMGISSGINTFLVCELAPTPPSVVITGQRRLTEENLCLHLHVGAQSQLHEWNSSSIGALSRDSRWGVVQQRLTQPSRLGRGSWGCWHNGGGRYLGTVQSRSAEARLARTCLSVY